jgi:hypothetical protein
MELVTHEGADGRPRKAPDRGVTRWIVHTSSPRWERCMRCGIRVEGVLDERLSGWFVGLQVASQSNSGA